MKALQDFLKYYQRVNLILWLQSTYELLFWSNSIWYICNSIWLVYHGIHSESLLILVYKENPSGKYQESTSGKWDIPWNGTRRRCITILYHARHRKYSGQRNQCDLRAARDGKFGCNIVQYTMAFLILIGCIFYGIVYWVREVISHVGLIAKVIPLKVIPQK